MTIKQPTAIFIDNRIKPMHDQVYYVLFDDSNKTFFNELLDTHYYTTPLITHAKMFYSKEMAEKFKRHHNLNFLSIVKVVPTYYLT